MKVLAPGDNNVMDQDREIVEVNAFKEPVNEHDNEHNIHPSSCFYLNRLGCPPLRVSASEMIDHCVTSLNALSRHISDTFVILSGKLTLKCPSSRICIVEEIKIINTELVAVYFAVKLTSLKCPKFLTESIAQHFPGLHKFFEDLLKFYSTQSDDSLSIEEFNVILSLGLLLSTISHFVDQNAQEQTESALILLVTLTPLQHLLESFKAILPPAHKSRLFALTLYRDLQRIEKCLEIEDTEQVAKIKVVMELAFLRYGDHFLNSYTDEILSTFNCENLINCPSVLWQKVSFGSSTVNTELGPSFLVNMSKFQWGIIKDYNGVVPDPSNDTLFVHFNLKNLFHFQDEQAQQFFILNSSLYKLLKKDQGFQASFNTDADTLKNIYYELMDHIVRLVMALDDNYTVTAQEESNKELSRLDSSLLLQSTKLHVLFLTLNLCILQLILTETLNIHSVPSISPVIEHYLLKSDFTCTIDTCTSILEFVKQFKMHSDILCTNYSMIKKLSSTVLTFLKGETEKTGILGPVMTWNATCYCLLLLILLVIQLVWFTNTMVTVIDDFFWF